MRGFCQAAASPADRHRRTGASHPDEFFCVFTFWFGSNGLWTLVVCAGIAKTNMSGCSLLETSNAVCSRLPSSCNDDTTIFGLLMPPSLRKTKMAAPRYSRVTQREKLFGIWGGNCHSAFIQRFFFHSFSLFLFVVKGSLPSEIEVMKWDWHHIPILQKKALFCRITWPVVLNFLTTPCNC